MAHGQVQDRLSVADVAAQAGVRPDTIRYYERAGLIPPPPRTAGDHRRYGTDVIDRLRFIRGVQRLGLRLRDIRDLLEVRDTGQCSCGPAGPMLRRRLGDVDAEIARLGALRSELARLLTRLPGPDCPEPVPGTWRRHGEGG
jgi:DNA-binding transcriptional MerR regulator